MPWECRGSAVGALRAMWACSAYHACSAHPPQAPRAQGCLHRPLGLPYMGCPVCSAPLLPPPPCTLPPAPTASCCQAHLARADARSNELEEQVAQLSSYRGQLEAAVAQLEGEAAAAASAARATAQIAGERQCVCREPTCFILGSLLACLLRAQPECGGDQPKHHTLVCALLLSSLLPSLGHTWLLNLYAMRALVGAKLAEVKKQAEADAARVLVLQTQVRRVCAHSWVGVCVLGESEGELPWGLGWGRWRNGGVADPCIGACGAAACRSHCPPTNDSRMHGTSAFTKPPPLPDGPILVVCRPQSVSRSW